jgi:acyl carrier protein
MEREELRRVLKEQLEDDTAREFGRLDDDLNLREGLGIDSVDMVTLIIHTQGRLGIEIRSEELDAVTTVGKFLDLLQSKLAGRARPAA